MADSPICSKHGTHLEYNCPECMEIWCKFLERENLYVVTDKND